MSDVPVAGVTRYGGAPFPFHDDDVSDVVSELAPAAPQAANPRTSAIDPATVPSFGLRLVIELHVLSRCSSLLIIGNVPRHVNYDDKAQPTGTSHPRTVVQASPNPMALQGSTFVPAENSVDQRSTWGWLGTRVPSPRADSPQPSDATPAGGRQHQKCGTDPKTRRRTGRGAPGPSVVMTRPVGRVASAHRPQGRTGTGTSKGAG